MSDGGKHFLLGVAVGAGVYSLFCWLTGEKATLRGLFGSSLACGTFALLPDLLEPATNPNHRSFFHSLTALGLLTCGNYKAMSNPKLTADDKLAVVVCSSGYGSHLLMDSITPKSLPPI